VDPRQLCVEVSDDGAGIAQNAQEQHNDGLEMLCRVGFSTKATVSMSSGHGLGLAAVKQALSYLRAQLSMTSSPHRGTSFQIVVPLN
jgi:two-component system chemotaxis sensor kinase CheA